MSYQVLARKWRPREFDQVVGQEHVVKALTNALEHDRMHHAYLFSGTRGVGKTTIARILAKALNCESRTSYEPCSQCSTCQAVDEGRFVDLIEVDAASRTKVEDTRELLENVQYSPTEGRYKIYLIDEVHMLSGHSFNALLKTLEEPPEHVKFLLATTDPQKVPVTVLSRCLQFNLKRMLPGQIREQLVTILERENIKFELAGLRILANAADGSMRDALSLLDQAIAYGGGSVNESEVLSMLDSAGREPVFDLLTAVAQGDPKTVLEVIDALADRNPDFAGVLQQMLMILHRIALAQMVPETLADDEDNESITELANRMNPEDVQLYYQTGLIGQKDLPLAPDPRSGFEMVLLRMLVFKPVGVESEPVEVVKRNDGLTNADQAEPAGEQNGRIGSEEAVVHDWLEMVQAMGIKGMAKELALHCALQDVDEQCCNLVLDPTHRQLRSDSIEKRLEKAIQNYFQKPIKMVIKLEKLEQEAPVVQLQRQRNQRQTAAEVEIEQDENVKALKEAFDARVIPGSIEPLD